MKTVMTNEQINERIAKLCGWTVDVEDYPEDGEMYVWTSPCGKEHFTGPGLYSESLDKCREFESKLTGDDRSFYMDHLYIIVLVVNIDARIGFEREWAMFNATPIQRCESFLRLKRKWD